MTLNKQLLADVVNHIITHPETHNQERYHCGTSHCFAGLTQVLAHGPMDQYPYDVMEDAYYLFASERTVSEIHRRTSRLISEDSCGKYDEYGRDRDGYDRDGGDQYGIGRDGYDRYGRDRDGRDRDGYDQCGHNRYGRDQYGRDRDGYDRDGRDQYGRDQYGRDRDGYDLDGRDRDGYNRDGRDQYGNPLPPIVVD